MVVAFVSLEGSAGLGGGVGGWAAEARRENKPLRGFDGAFVVAGGVVVGVGEEMTLAMGVGEEDEEALSAERDCGVTGSGFVRERFRPLLLFVREPGISTQAVQGGRYLLNVHLQLHRCPSNRIVRQEGCGWREL